MRAKIVAKISDILGNERYRISKIDHDKYQISVRLKGLQYNTWIHKQTIATTLSEAVKRVSTMLEIGESCSTLIDIHEILESKGN